MRVDGGLGLRANTLDSNAEVSHLGAWVAGGFLRLVEALREAKLVGGRGLDCPC